MEYIEKTLTGIITHGTNSITFTDDFITNESIIDVYFSSDDIIPTDQKQDGNRLIISVEPQTYDVSIAVHITNDDTINYSDELESLSNTVDEHTTAISDLAIDVDTLENKVDGLNASNISYDEHSTLYSAIGDIDTLETENKNLVGAINELKESGGGSQVLYDDIERVIGTWFRKPLYRKVLTITSPVTFQNIGDYLTIPCDGIPNIEVLVNAGIESNGRFLTGWIGKDITGVLKFMNFRSGMWILNNGHIIIEYTKVGD